MGGHTPRTNNLNCGAAILSVVFVQRRDGLPRADLGQRREHPARDLGGPVVIT